METIEIKGISIREHRAVISELMRGLHESEYQFFNKTANWKDISASYMRHVITMQEACEGACFVAYAGAKAVGFIFGYVEEQDDARIEVYTGKELYISDGYVLPEWRRRGIYKLLNESIEQKFIALGVGRITRFTLINNTPMKTFLLASGFTATRVLYEKWL